jgi:hypothetical protein
MKWDIFTLTLCAHETISEVNLHFTWKVFRLNIIIIAKYIFF